MSHTSRPTENGVRVFHEGVEEKLLSYVHEHATRNNPNSVLKAIDEFCFSNHWMMHIGQEKAEVIVNAILAAKQSQSSSGSRGEHFVVVELGSYCGYSATRIASNLDPLKNEKLFCIELVENCVSWASRMVSFAGLADRVQVIHSPVSQVNDWKAIIANSLGISIESLKINILFVDHDKKEYYNDVKAIVESGLLATDSVVIADNVLSFNSPKQDYLDYVRDSVNGPFKASKLVEGFIEYCTEEERATNPDYLKDGIEISVFR